MADSAALRGELAVVTGATGGLGSACARALAHAGAEVVLLSRSPDALRALAAEIGRAGGTAHELACDAASPDAVEAAFSSIAAPHVLVGCVGGNRPAPFIEVGAADLDWALRTNVRAAFVPAQSAARRMIAASRGGSIVLVTSQMGRVGAPLRTAYCAAKHAVEGLVKAMAVELAPHAIRVNAVAPTFVETPMSRPFLADPAFRAQVLDSIPLGRLGTAAEVADAVLLAATCELMTGASVAVDGGWTAR